MDAPLRRSELATPATNDRMFAKAAASGADLVFLDLEDAVAPAQREVARGKAVRALTELDWGATTRAIRMNGVGTRWAYGDVIEVVTGARESLDTIIVPKVTAARDVWWVDVLLTQLEETLGLTERIRLEVLIEDVAGVAHAEEIATASDRLDALIFGAGDLSVSQRARVDTNFRPRDAYPGDFWHFARMQVLTAARVGGVLALDAPYPDYRDAAGYEEDARCSASLGFDGKWAIHPSQVDVANRVYAPTTEEVARARRNLDAYAVAQADGLGATGVDGQLVDAAHVKLAQEVLERVAAIERRAAR
ncbi:CoA ester lyase [Pseudonocardia sp. KRD-184]|uniref:CoA ester lyase n=1 Tax=Pseudonocardia oceani TaxID=2792013 RepID=A0ABS6U4G8_9PSEU|nr:CoA ester lyase [Pseudonocardia oceani]MBW0090700.1 CoA ester lyase [Pseudonocardia oceani]MBW0097612.1 CoA ester lyase [Pseudonocardia oceani]MBW0124335.1 CoA ester lyase [Pseudonocardia oceani]MBW0127081.1 CoA ester lyase [Pseudonocardia oceani]